MNKPLLLLFLLFCLKGFSQDPRLIQNTWYFTQIESPNIVRTQPTRFRNVGIGLNMETNGDFDTYAFNDCVGQVSYDMNNTDFVLNSVAATLAFTNDPIIDNFDQEYTQFFTAFQGQTFSYSINTVGTIETLQIVNSAGKTAVYQNVPLSTSSFQLANIKIFLSQNRNQIVVDSKEVSLSLLSFELFDLSGKALSNTQKLEDQLIDISHLKSGLYILRISQRNGHSKTFKFIK